VDGQLGLQLGDAALRGGQLRLLGAAQPRLQTPIDPVLTPSGVDRLGADPEIPRDVGDRPPGIDQVEHLPPELRRITTPAHEPSSGVKWPGFHLLDSAKAGADQSLH